jgi:hypothetical protein
MWLHILMIYTQPLVNKSWFTVCILKIKCHYIIITINFGQTLLEYEANTAMTFGNNRVCAIDFLLSTTIDGLVCFEMMKSLLLHGCAIDYNHVTLQKMTMSPLFACIFYLKPAAILVLLYEFGCQRWDFNWRDNRLYEKREDGEFVTAYVNARAGNVNGL